MKIGSGVGFFCHTAARSLLFIFFHMRVKNALSPSELREVVDAGHSRGIITLSTVRKNGT